MRIAIFGATSHLAKDLILSFSHNTDHDLILYARHPMVVDNWLADHSLLERYQAVDFSAFGVGQHFDAILNFVGVGNPARAVAMGKSIFGITRQYDELVLEYLHKHSACRYFFLSSGAVYGGSFCVPVDESSTTQIAINNLLPQDWYGIAKLYAECQHRAFADLAIVDIRVFSYFSSTQDMAARFFISDTLRAIRSGEILETSAVNIVRDYLGAEDFYQLVDVLLSAGPTNDSVDCYTKAPVDKFSLLEALQNRHGLKYEIPSKTKIGVNATGMKINYYSRNVKAARFGYVPRWDSLEIVLDGMSSILTATNTK